ncbi:glycosyltransferase family 2 protein [Vibrio aestuarianus]|nr:glycosyltransferase family 2 protein [Vibrio aestuarianus]
MVVKSNKPGDLFESLNNKHNFHQIDGSYGCGFGENNNIVFDYCCSVLGMKEDDYFIVLNPDVIIKPCMIKILIEYMERDRINLAAINLFKDEAEEVYDNSIRQFPSLLQFVKSFLGFNNDSLLDKNQLTSSIEVDWAAGSFLAFRASHYKALKGFDEKYFMYCEDIDICYRSCLVGERVTYFPDVKAIHLAKHENRKLFSKHFYWHVSSVFRFFFGKIKSY